MKGLTIWSLVCVTGCLLAFLFFTSEQRYTGSDLSFGVNSGDRIAVSGPEVVEVKASSSTYFRIISGGSLIKSEPFTDNTFVATGTLNSGNWTIPNGGNIRFSLTSSSTPISVTVSPGYGTIFLVALVCIFLSLLIWAFGALAF